MDFERGALEFDELLQASPRLGITIEGHQGGTDHGWSSLFDFAGNTARGLAHVSLSCNVISNPGRIGTVVRIQNAAGVQLGGLVCRILAEQISAFGLFRPMSVFNDDRLVELLGRERLGVEGVLTWYSWIIVLDEQARRLVDLAEVLELAAGSTEAICPGGATVTLAYGFEDPGRPPGPDWWAKWKRALAPAITLTRIRPEGPPADRPVEICPEDWA